MWNLFGRVNGVGSKQRGTDLILIIASRVQSVHTFLLHSYSPSSSYVFTNNPEFALYCTVQARTLFNCIRIRIHSTYKRIESYCLLCEYIDTD